MLLAQDNARRADNADLGANWTPTVNSMRIVNDEFGPQGGGGNFDAVEVYTGRTWPDDQYCEIVIGSISTGNAGLGACAVCRGSNSAITLYRLAVASVGWQMAKFVVGSFSSLGINSSPTFTAGDVVRLETRTVGGNCAWVAKKNGTQFASGTDSSSPIASGYVGLGYSGEPLAADSRIAAWAGGNLDDTTPGPTTANWHDAVSGTTVTIPFYAPTGSVITVDIPFVDTGGKTITGVTYNGQTFTELFDSDLSSAAEAAVSRYMGVAGADGALHNVVVTLSADIGSEYAGALVTGWQGIKNSSVAAAHRTIYSAGDSAGAGVNVTVIDSVAGDIVTSSVFTFNGADVLAAVGTAIEVQPARFGTSYDWGVQYTTASGANTVMSWTNDEFCTHVAYALVPDTPTDTMNIPGRRIYVTP